MINILFWLYKYRTNKKGLSPLKMRITLDGKRTEIPTNIELSEEKWDHQRQRVRGRSAQALQYNKIIETFRSLAWKYYEESLKKQLPMTAVALKNAILLGSTSQHTLLD